MPVGGGQPNVDKNTRQIHKSKPPWMCGYHKVKARAGDNTGQNTKNTHPIQM